MHKDIKTSSTEEVARHRQIDYWNALISNTFTALDAFPISGERFSGRLQKAPLSDLSIAEVLSTPTIVSHTQAMVSDETSPFFLLHLQLNGSSINRQRGREALLKAGDFTLCDSTCPYNLSFTEPNNMLVLRIPEKKLRSVLRAPEDVTCIHMAGHMGMSGVASSLLTRLWEGYESGWDLEYQKKIADIVLNTLAISYAEVCKKAAPETSLQQTRRIQIRHFIETNLNDPQLSPGFIADALDISPRYLHMLYKPEGETVAQTILRRRLEESRRRLTDTANAGLTVSEIAYALGFNSATHFGRVFKEKYDVTPTAIRFTNAR